jgi:nucleotide-binding universal stress UspA family protein
LKSDDVAKGIEDFLNEKNVEMLAMIPRKHTLIEKLFRRSITEKIAQHCNVPLLAIHA